MMGKKSISTILVLFIAVVVLAVLLSTRRSGERDLARMPDEVSRLMEEKKYPEALELLRAFYELSFHKRSDEFAGVRSSFLMHTWKELGGYYPFALEEMRRIRDRKESLLRSGNISGVEYDPIVLERKNPTKIPEKSEAIIAKAIMHDIRVLNTTLVEQERTIALFEYLQKSNPAWAKACFPAARKDILEMRRYDLAGQYITDYQAEFQSILHRHDYLLRNKVSQQFADNALMKGVTELVRLALAEGRIEAATELLRAAGKVTNNSHLDKLSAEIEEKKFSNTTN